jgi:hypothetical protein
MSPYVSPYLLTRRNKEKDEAVATSSDDKEQD